MASLKHQQIFIATVKKAIEFQKLYPVRAEQELRSLPSTWQVAYDANEPVGKIKNAAGIVMLGKEAFN